MAFVSAILLHHYFTRPYAHLTASADAVLAATGCIDVDMPHSGLASPPHFLYHHLVHCSGRFLPSILGAKFP